MFMPISKKILDEIGNLEESNEFKKLLIEMLDTEAKGNHRNNQLFDKLVDDYLESTGQLKKGDDENGD